VETVKPFLLDSQTNLTHQLPEKPQVMHRAQPLSQSLIVDEQVSEVAAGVGGTTGAAAGFVNRTRILPVTGIF
tara:strand:- start:65 stop:283 length:219 start_codon:yes stop_codon:yes gene_type:complete